MKHYMHLNKEPFEKIKNGTKTIEMRVYDEKRRKMHKGDIIEIENRTTGEIMTVEIINMHVLSSFGDIYARWNKIALGYNEEDVAKPADMEQYYPKEEIEENGVVAIELKVIK